MLNFLVGSGHYITVLGIPFSVVRDFCGEDVGERDEE